MAWVIDTCVLLDIRIGHPTDYANNAAACLEKHVSADLVICPISFVELAPIFHGDIDLEKSWLDSLAVSYLQKWQEADTIQSHQLWHEHIQRKRQGILIKRPIADILIAAFSLRFQGIITRNATDFRSIAPALKIIVP